MSEVPHGGVRGSVFGGDHTTLHLALVLPLFVLLLVVVLLLLMLLMLQTPK